MTRKALLTLAAISEATGESDHAQLEEVEIIFGPFEEIDALALRQCRSLQRLTLTQISGLDAVGATLLHLSLSDQQLARIEGLSALVNLRSLCLQQNRIEVIEGLQSCTKLQKLWLFGNRIAKVENLATCSDLRELWLQDNRIQTLDCDGNGISVLVNLQSLHVANNRIRLIDELESLRKLLHLREVSFSDEHFGSNPIANHPDYRAFAVSTLKQLGTLDGIPIDRSERAEAEDLFLAQALEFNDSFASLTLAFENEMRIITGRRERGLSNAQMLQQELVSALNELEEYVTDGHEQIRSEMVRQQRLRDENTAILEENVEAIKERYHAAIERQMAREASALRDEELKFEYLELEALAEHRLVSAVTALQSSFPTKIAFQFLPDHSLDHRHIAAHFHSQKRGDGDPRVDELDNADENRSSGVELLQVVRFYHCDLAAAFENAVATQHTDPSEGAELYLFVVASEGAELDHYLRLGITQHGESPVSSRGRGAKGGDGGEGDDDIGGWLFLFSNPLQALSFYRGSVGESCSPEYEFEHSDTENDQGLCESSEARIETLRLLLCRVRMPQTLELFYPEKRHLTSLESLHAVATPKGSILQPPPSAFLQLELGGSAESRDPEGSESDEICDEDVEMLGLDDRTSPSAAGILSQFQEALDAEVAAHHARLYAEVDPAQVRFRSQFLDQQRQLDEQLRHQRMQLEHEKNLQDQLVRSLQGEQNQQQQHGRRQ